MAKRQKMHIKIGDTVKVITGSNKNKIGEVIKIYSQSKKLLVKGINLFLLSLLMIV